jgi:hypothetical protein
MTGLVVVALVLMGAALWGAREVRTAPRPVPVEPKSEEPES